MMVKEITITDYSSPNPICELQVPKPSLADIEQAIRSLNGNERSSLALNISQEHYLAIGGGSEVFICQFFPDMCRLLNSNVPAENNQFLSLVVGQRGEFAEKECVPLEVVLKAAKHFAETGQMDCSLQWEQYG